MAGKEEIEVLETAEDIAGRRNQVLDRYELFKQLAKATYLKELLASRMLVILSLPTCPQCDALAAYLEENGIENPRQYFTKWDKADEAVPLLN